MFVRVGDVRLFFDTEGSKFEPHGPLMREKPTLLCLHGGPGLDHSVFRPAFSSLADIAQIIYLDQRGHGRSDHSIPERWSLAQWADDIAGFCEILSIEHPVILGVSFGGYVGMTYAIRHPDALVKLILISTSARGTGNAIRRRHVLRSFESRGGAEARQVVERVFDERTPEAYAHYRRICGPLYNWRAADPNAVKRMVSGANVLAFFERPNGEGASFDLTQELEGIRCPTLVVSGEDDPITPIEEQKTIVDSMRGGIATHLIFSNCGHGVLRDNPDGLVAAIRKFVISQDRILFSNSES